MMELAQEFLPGYVSGKFTDRNVFYSSYLQTYIDRDVSELVTRADKQRSYSNNLLRCTIKTPKMYFFDV